MENLDINNGSKIDSSIGLLANIPQTILGKLSSKLNINSNENEKIEITILYRNDVEKAKSVVEDLGGDFYDLEFNFAIVNIILDKLGELALSNEIQYIELPKSLYESDLQSNRASCVEQAASTYDVTGKGVIIGFIDSGIDYTHPAFMNEEGTTRIEYIYDLGTNKLYDKNQINEAIKSQDPYSIVPEEDLTGHGTHVVGDACSGGKLPATYRGAAPGASIIMVKGTRGRWVLSSQIMKGLKFLLDKSKELNMPLVVNISLSTNDGAHNGSSLLEQYIRTIANLEKITIVVAAGNEGDAAHHTGAKFTKVQSESFNTAADETSLVINMYKSILPDVSIKIIGPTGQSSQSITVTQGYFTGNIGRDRYDLYVAGPKPFELNSEIQIIISPISSQYLVEGTWSIEISVLNEYEGMYSMWLPISEGLNTKTKFLTPKQLNTLGIPATVDNVIAVGSYNSRTDTLSSFSGRGPESTGYDIRPDIVAPGENILGPLPGGGYDSKTGTSMATPQVTGICALLTEWGIVKGNDPYLFGQRLKYYLVKGANRTRQDISYPNSLWGYGTVCAFDSFSILENTINSLAAQRNIKDYRFNETREVNEPTVDNSTSESENIYENTKSSLQNLINIIKSDSTSDDNQVIGLLIQVFTPQDLEEINKLPDTSGVFISATFAIIRIPLNQIVNLSPYVKEIVTVYNPSIYTLTALSPIEASGVPLFSQNPYISLDGTDTLVGIIDTGIDYLNKEFMLEDDTTRILKIWDQTIESDQTIQGMKFGSEYSEEQINKAIQLSKKGGDPYSIVPTKDEIGHGTMSAGIIGGRGINPELIGAAPNCKFLVVKVSPVASFILKYSGVPLNKIAYGNIELILAIRYLSKVSSELKKPMVIYFPFGTNTGAHDGTGDIEGILEVQGRRVGVVPVVGTGNQGDTQTHIEGKINTTGDMETIEVKVGKNQQDLNFQIYCQKPDKVELGIVSPSGEVLDKVDVKIKELSNYKFVYEGTTVTIIYLYPDENNGDETIIIKFKDIREGTWQFRLYGEKIVDGRYWAWLPQRELLDPDTRFFDPIKKTTLTIPATARGVAVTAYYNQDLNTTVSQSGNGYTRDGRIKPDIASGGVNAIVAKPGGGTGTATGSSIATAVLAGCCALILQWAIVNKNDPEMRAKKLISYIIRGAKMRQGDIYPNIEWGYGLLNIKDIFDAFRSEKQLERIRSYIELEEKDKKFKKFRDIRGLVGDKEYAEFTIRNLFFRIPR